MDFSKNNSIISCTEMLGVGSHLLNQIPSLNRGHITNSPVVAARLLLPLDDDVLSPSALFTLLAAVEVSDRCNDGAGAALSRSPLSDCDMKVSGFGPELRHAPTRIS